MTNDEAFDPCGWQAQNARDLEGKTDATFTLREGDRNPVLTSVPQSKRETIESISVPTPAARDTKEYPSVGFVDGLLTEKASKRNQWLDENAPEDKVDSGLYKVVDDQYVNLADKPVEHEIDVSDFDPDDGIEIVIDAEEPQDNYTPGENFQESFPDDPEEDIFSSFIERDQFASHNESAYQQSKGQVPRRQAPEISFKDLANMVVKGEIRGCRTCHEVYSHGALIPHEVADQAKQHFKFNDPHMKYGLCSECDVEDIFKKF